MRPGLGALVNEELQRLSAAAATGLSGTPPEERFDRITRLARSVFRVPVARIMVVDDDRFFIKSPQTDSADLHYSRQGSICNLVVEGTEMIVVSDAAEYPQFAASARAQSVPWIRFYAGRPLMTSTGHQVGVLCLIDDKPRNFDREERALLDQMAGLVEQELAATRVPTLSDAKLEEWLVG